jgi:hypothetical protein
VCIVNFGCVVVELRFSRRFNDVVESEWVNLDSTSAEKFSRHLILNSKQLVFKDTVSVGAFVTQLIAEVASKRSVSAELDALFVRTNEESPGVCKAAA